MKSRKVIIAVVVFVGIISILAIFGGVFGEYSDERNEVIGYVAEDGTLLDLDGNPIDDQPAFYDEHESDSDLNTVFEEDENEDERMRAIREEEEAMANPPRFEISAAEVHEIIASLSLTNHFDVVFNPGGARGNDLVSTISIVMVSDDPLRDEDLIDELRQIATSISERLGIRYPREDVDNIMRAVFESEVYVDVVRYEDIAQFEFGIISTTGRTDGEYALSISAS